MSGRFVDWISSILTAKTSSIDGTESVPIVNSTGTAQKATLANAVRYGGGSPRNTTAGNATVTQTTDGAMYLEVAGQTAGNARGAGAFDWQAVRTNAARVASGANAIAIGKECTASSAGSIAIGESSSATTGANAIAIGMTCTSTGTASLSAGYQSTSSGAYSVALGLYCTAGGISSIALGKSVKADNTAQFVFGHGVATNNSQAQGNLQTFYTVTANATSTPLNITGTATDMMVIPATRACTFIGVVTAMDNISSSSNFVKAWKIEGCITRDTSNTIRIVGTPTITVIAQDIDGTPTPSTWAIASITADETNKALAINVTGQTGQTIRWQATLLYSQIGF